MSTQIVVGLHVDIEEAELKVLLLGRLGYHEERAALYSKQLEGLLAIDASMEEEASKIGKYSNTQSAADNMKETIKSHRDKAVYYRFMADHTIAGATYRLSEADLTRLGVKAY